MAKTETVVFAVRVPKSLHLYLSRIAKMMGLKPSELGRLIFEYFLIAYTLGEWTKPLSKLRKELSDFLESNQKKKRRI